MTIAAIKERPIIFSAPMVRALLSGAKTQTRRIVKADKIATVVGRNIQSELDNDVPRPMPDWQRTALLEKCPYGSPGTKLWVRETWRPILSGRNAGKADYRADDPSASGDGFIPWKPSIHMRRTDSRLTLELTDVRVERVQEISEADARAEGITRDCPVVLPYKCKGPLSYHFAALWDQINGVGSWAANPWVWVLSFRRLEATR